MPASIGVNMRVTGHYSQGGRKHMEDMFSVAYQQTEDERDLEYAYFGIFDGHGGSEAAAYAKDHLMEAIVRQKLFWSERDADVLRAIRNGYMLTHMHMWKELDKWPKAMHGLPSTAGTTASVAFIRRGKIYIGHVGDSAIVLGYQVEGKDEWSAMPLTMDHKPESEVEMQRIYSSGGKVSEKLGVPRVVWNRFIMNKGELRHIEIPFLAIARSLGDHWSYNTNTNEFVVSPDPDVGVVAIDPAKFRCLIFGTDGLWNMISSKNAVELVQQVQQQNEMTATKSQSPDLWQNPSKILVDTAIKRWANIKALADNTSVVTVMMDPPGPPRVRPAFPPSSMCPSLSTNSCSNESALEDENVTHKIETPSVSKHTHAETPTLPPVKIHRESTSKVAPPKPQSSNVIPPLPPVSDISQFPQTSHLSTPANNPLHIDTEDEEQNSSAESYFIARLLSKSDIKNSLEHVYDEIMKTCMTASNPTPDCEQYPNNNNETEDTSTKMDMPETNIPIVDPVEEEPVPEVKPDEIEEPEINPESENEDNAEINVENDDEENPDAPVEGESIQINEVSSSSPVDSSPKFQKKKNFQKSTPAEQQSSRNLRSHDNQQTSTPKPQTRHNADKNRPGNTVAPNKKVVDSKVPVPVHTPKILQNERPVVIQTRPKISISPSNTIKNAHPVKVDKKNTEKIVKIQKPLPAPFKPVAEKVENKIKQANTKVDDVKTPNVRVTRSRDSQTPSADTPKIVAKEAGSNPAKKFHANQESTKPVVKDFPRESIVTRHKTTNVAFPASKKLGPKEQPNDQILSGGSECCKENMITPTAQNSGVVPLKSAKRRSAVEGKQDVEPKRKRLTRLNEKRKEQHEDVTSSEVVKEPSEFILGLNDNHIPESSNENHKSPELNLSHKLKQKNKRKTIELPAAEVHSTTLIVDKSESESASRALRSKQEASKMITPTSDKRALRSTNCATDPGNKESRPILRTRNSVGVLTVKATTRRRIPWAQMSRHSPRKRCAK